MKNYFKKVVFCFFALVFGVAFFGCSYTQDVVVKSNGVITTSIDIDMSDTSINTFNTVSRIVDIYYKQLDKKYNDTLINYFSNVYDFDELELSEPAQKVDYIIKANINKLLVGDTEFEKDTQKRKITLDKQFVSIYAYVMYFNPTQSFVYDEETNSVVISSDYKSLIDIPLSGEVDEKDGIFISSYIQTCNPFYYDGEEPKFLYDYSQGGIEIHAGESLVNYLVTRTHISQEEVDKYFNFSTPYRRVHSDGDVKLTDDGYTHTWQVGNVDAQIKLWRSSANYVSWYVLAILVGVHVFVIGLIVVAIIRAKKKKVGMKALRDIERFTKL